MDIGFSSCKRALVLAWGSSLKNSTLIPAQGQREEKEKKNSEGL